VTAPLPAGTTGHSGAELRRFIRAQCHQGQVTVAPLVEQFRGFGLSISKRQAMRLLIVGQNRFLGEACAVLRAGPSSARWKFLRTAARGSPCVFRNGNPPRSKYWRP
jgi:hypothetical protein